jgi:hypothetical protein
MLTAVNRLSVLSHSCLAGKGAGRNQEWLCSWLLSPIVGLTLPNLTMRNGGRPRPVLTSSRWACLAPVFDLKVTFSCYIRVDHWSDAAPGSMCNAGRPFSSQTWRARYEGVECKVILMVVVVGRECPNPFFHCCGCGMQSNEEEHAGKSHLITQ